MGGVILGRGELFGQAQWLERGPLVFRFFRTKCSWAGARAGDTAFRVLRGGVAAGTVPILTFQWGRPLQGQNTAAWREKVCCPLRVPASALPWNCMFLMIKHVSANLREPRLGVYRCHVARRTSTRLHESAFFCLFLNTMCQHFRHFATLKFTNGNLFYCVSSIIKVRSGISRSPLPLVFLRELIFSCAFR